MYDGAGAVVHQHTKEPIDKTGLVQVGEIAAVGKAFFVNGAFVVAKEYTGHIGHDGIAAEALGKVLGFGFSRGQVEMLCKKRTLLGRNADHQCFAAVAALGAIDLWGNRIVKVMYQRIDLGAILFLKKDPELIILFFFSLGNGCQNSKIGL